MTTNANTPPSPLEDLGLDLGKQVAELRAMEEKLQSTMNTMIIAIADKIRNTEIPDVVPISKAPICFMVPFRTVAENSRWNLSAEYYFCERQADLVKIALTASMKSGSITGIVNKLVEMASNQAVVVNKRTYALNLTTVRILQEACRSIGAG